MSLDLQQFLGKWKEEIRVRPPSLGKRDSHRAEIHEDEVSRTKRPPIANKTTNDPFPLLVLPAGQSHDHIHHSQSRGDDDNRGKEKRLVDTLIADLNEINTVPFFDVELPREIAVLIFGYLDVRDLCNCAMVSRSWNVLANDNLLWYKHHCRINPSDQCTTPLHCKSAVQDLIVQRRQVQRNWKERMCGVSDHQPDNCRALCCLSYSEGHILSCYSSGAVYVWDVSSDEEPSLVRQIPGPYLGSEPSCCDTVGTSLGVIGTRNGCLKIIDMDTCSQVYCLSDLGCVNSVSASRSEGCLAVAVGSMQDSINMQQPNHLSVLIADRDNSWERTELALEEIQSHITKVKVLSYGGDVPCSLLYSTYTSLTLHPLHSKPTHILSSLGERGRATCISCFESDRDMSVVACGTSAFGYQVQLFDLPSGASKVSLKGHGQQVTSISFSSSSSSSSSSNTHPHNMVVSGSSDKRVRLFDCRCSTPFPVHTLKGHGGAVHHVQMDHWKVTSGSSDGMLIIWDQRMALELWRTQERHPIGYCGFDDRYLICGHVPLNKHPIRGENPNICHRRLRGLVRAMDFSVDPLYYTRKLPSICSSNYDEPSASSFNLDLKFPYDAIS